MIMWLGAEYGIAKPYLKASQSKTNRLLMVLLPTHTLRMKRFYWATHEPSLGPDQTIKGGLEDPEPGSSDLAVLASFVLHRRKTPCTLLEAWYSLVMLAAEKKDF
jgi:hypothetical protein